MSWPVRCRRRARIAALFGGEENLPPPPPWPFPDPWHALRAEGVDVRGDDAMEPVVELDPTNTPRGRRPEDNPAVPHELPRGPYTDSNEHLWDELARVDQLLRAQTIRWLSVIASHKPENEWGMVHVTHAEVSAYLRAPYVPPQMQAATLRDALGPYLQAAEAMRHDIEARLAQTPPSVALRLVALQRRFGLSDAERDVILLLLMPELDARHRRLLAYLQDDAARTQPTVQVLIEILQPLVPDTTLLHALLGSDGKLSAHRLIALRGAERDESLSSRSLHLDERIGGFILGSVGSDARLRGVVNGPVASARWEDLCDDAKAIERLQGVAGIHRDAQGEPLLCLMRGADGSGRLLAARAICTEGGRALLVADAEAALRSALGWEGAVDLSYREARLHGAALYWAACDVLLAPDQPGFRWTHLIATAARHPDLSFFASHRGWEPPAGGAARVLHLDFPAPSFDRRRRLWQRHLATAPLEREIEPKHAAGVLASAFQMTPGQMQSSLATALSLAQSRGAKEPRLRMTDLLEACRRQSTRQLATFAKRVEPRADLDERNLVLPDANTRQFRELLHRVRHRAEVYARFGLDARLSLGKGLIALFTGSSGTGKTLAAEVLASAQSVDLYKVDMAAVVSKYVGETEKHLAQVFSEAEDANAIIFFDEADALFGKRGEVKEARDRWANLEVNYLLQRIEEYAGVVILASNLRQNIDDAFLRRIHMIVEFPFPDVEQRCGIWGALLPGGGRGPGDDDLRELARRFRLAGGAIKNVVVDAAFRAAAESPQGAIEQRHLVLAIAREYQKLGKPITRNEFGEEFYGAISEAGMI